MRSNAIQDKYTPKLLEKYDGNAKKITYRSMWERIFMFKILTEKELF